MANGNGQVEPLQAAGKATRFGAPGGPDPAEAGHKGGTMKEAAIQANIEKAREYAVAHLGRAVEVFVEALEADWEKGRTHGPEWFVRLKAAKELIDRIMGQAPQRVEVSTVDEFTRRMDDLLNEMDEHSDAPA